MQFKDVVIETSPYYYEDNKYNETVLVIDEGVAVAVNDTPYIKLSNAKNEDGDKPKVTTCRYHLSTPNADINIKVGVRKAIINKITIYY